MLAVGVWAVWALGIIGRIQGIVVKQKESLSVRKVSRADGVYEVFQNDNYIGSFLALDDAIDFSSQYAQIKIREKSTAQIIWDNYPPFNVYTGGEGHEEFDSFKEAIEYAKTAENAYIYHRKNNALLWNTLETPPASVQIQNVPLILQKPELERGCEVTSLAMLLQFAGVDAGKMALAEEIRKDPAPYRYEGGQAYFGNPYQGFVGDIYSKGSPGYGVYHGPVYDLLSRYLPNRAIDLTGSDFEHLTYFVYKEKPVWIITNYTFKPLTQDKFTSFTTQGGERISITYYEHSVLVTGYDDSYVYFNDPLNSQAARSAPKSEFILAWEQMGRQAVSYY